MATSNQPVSGPVSGGSGPTRTDIVRATKEANLPAGKIPPAAQAMINERQIRASVAQKVRGAQWGITDQRTAKALADYCYNNRIDPIRHVEVLGGRVYLKAEYYQEKGAEMIARGLIEGIDKPDHIEADPRLDEAYLEAVKFAAECQERGQADEAQYWTEQANAARREIARRRMKRIAHGAPEKAAAVVVYRIRAKELDEPILGCNWCGGGVRGKSSSGKWNDPVGEAEPSKTAETRAARRAWKQLCAVVPAVAQAVGVLAAEEEGAALEDLIAEGAALSAGDDESTPQPVLTSGNADPYAEPAQLTAGTAPDVPAAVVEDDPFALPLGGKAEAKRGRSNYDEGA